ncbi:MAG: hypothetical protein LBT05_11670 [Planctomycetaceae bacterium]|jgi:hypothetical protein|nr:hypothetical protein [Planctomycetaceae bacterium]
MYENGDNVLRRVDWQQVCPAVLLPRAFRFALGVRVFIFALLGVLLTSFAVNLFLSKTALQTANLKKNRAPITKELQVDLSASVFTLLSPEYWRRAFVHLYLPMYYNSLTPPTPVLFTGTPDFWRIQLSHTPTANHPKFSKTSPPLNVPTDIPHCWTQLTATGFKVFFPPKCSFYSPAFWNQLVWFLIILIIWGTIGGAITRIIALRFAADRRESLLQLFHFVRKKWLSYIGAIILPTLGIFCALIPVWIFQWLFGIFHIDGALYGTIVAWIFFALTFPFALIATLITIGFAFGWPLMFAAVSAEGSDAFDAVSRAFSYVYQRPVQFVFYHVCNLVVYTFAVGLAYFAFCETVRQIGLAPNNLLLIFDSFAFAYFWSSSTVIYFLLRRSCDATPLDEVYLPDVKKETLPPILVHENGVAEIQEK